MRTDVTSMFFNSSIDGKTATPAWGTSIGQSKQRQCRIDDFKPEVVNMIVGMTYKCVSDLSKLNASKGSSKREILICSLFTDIFINDIKVENSQFALLLVREHSESHDGRLIISYAPYIEYNGIPNQCCIDKMQKTLNCNSNGCWFVYDISIKEQSELHFKAVVVDAEKPRNYDRTKTSQMRSAEWNAMIPEEGLLEVYTPPILLQIENKFPIQQIFYGAPGTGKSHIVNEQIEGESVIRTTFHPDSDYSTFVGAYKPTTKEVELRDVSGHKIVENGHVVTEDRIVYEFVEQAFLQAYIKSWKFYAENEDAPKKQYLIIEEINRGNCAQIFGDLFQLLDRNQWGFSDYPINADKDMKKQLRKAFKDISINNPSTINSYYKGRDVTKEVLDGDILLLPNNLFIWATMNTSDQSLFPIDSAFKRRWDWQYMPIVQGRDEAGNELKWTIDVNGKKYSWWSFIEKINAQIGETTQSEDKKLGFFFCKAKNGVISPETFVGKVVFYLWNDVFKDYGFEGSIFKDVDNSELSFNKFYKADLKGNAIVQSDKVEFFLNNLGVEIIETKQEEEFEEDEDGNDISSPITTGRNYDKFSINGVGRYAKNNLAAECVKKYIELNPGITAEEVMNNWSSFKSIVPHFMESKDEFDTRTDNSKRSHEIQCNGSVLYVAHNGYGNNGKAQVLMDAVNQKDWGLTIERHKA